MKRGAKVSTFGERLKNAREKMNISQAELATAIDVKSSSGVISNWERDLNKPDAEKIIKLCDVLQVSVSYLLDYYGNSDFETTLSEQEHIKKYRSLEKNGQNIVDFILDNEYNHVMALKKQSETEHIQETNPDYQFIVESDRLYMTQYDYGVSAGIGNFLDEWDVPKTTVQIADSPIARQSDYILKVDGDSMMPKFEDGDRVFVKAQETVEMNEIGIFVIDGTCFLKQFKGDKLHSLNPTYDDIALNEFQNIKCVGKVLGKV